MVRIALKKINQHALPGSLLVFILMFPAMGFSQGENPDLIERTVERVSETTDHPVDFSDVSETLEKLRDHPINLNNTNPEQLSQILFLDDRQINNLLNYIETYGTIYSVYELKVIDGFDSATIRKILPYVSVGQEMEKHPIRLKDLIPKGKNQLFIRGERVIQKQAGYSVDDSALEKNPNSGYAGSPVKLFFRYTYSFYDRLLIGLSGEKDAGEQFFRGYQKNGFDFYSGYVSLQNTGILKQLTIGNFNLAFGQGLTLSSGISAGAIPGTGNVRRYSRGITPSQSTNEGSYLRGIAMVLKKWNFRLSVFYSNHKRDANITTSDTITGDDRLMSSFTETGYHRIPREVEDKNVIRESILGGNLNFRNSFLSLGITGFRSRWDASLEPKTYPYNIFNFRGKENLNIGMDFQAVIQNTYLFGECSRSGNGGMAFLAGMQANPDPRLMLSLTLRDYQRNYQDILSNALGQNSSNSNEEGILFTFNASIAPGLNLTGYADLYRFRWLKYRTDSPSIGNEYQLQSDYSVGRSVKMYFRFRTRSKQINIPDPTRNVNILDEIRSMTIRYQADWQVTDLLVLKNRFEWQRNRQGKSSPAYGYLCSQNFTYKLPRLNTTLSFLYALFDTDSYDERIYIYESDVLYGYSVPAYSGKGLRCLLLTSWSPSRWFELWLRYAQTWYSDRNVIGTGLDQINGNTKSEVEIQIRFRF